MRTMPYDEMMSKLKTCPHCGEKPFIETRGGGYLIICAVGCNMGAFCDEGRAIKAWNRRSNKRRDSR